MDIWSAEVHRGEQTSCDAMIILLSFQIILVPCMQILWKSSSRALKFLKKWDTNSFLFFDRELEDNTTALYESAVQPTKLF